jgi:hypothetical protein
MTKTLVVPQPVAEESLPPPPFLDRFAPAKPSALRITQVVEKDEPELAIIFKRTYRWSDAKPARLAEEQLPVDEQGGLYEPLADGVAPSVRSLPELIGLKTGTDIVVQGSARPARPVATMQVAVEVAGCRHAVDVIGTRYCEYRHGQLDFSEPLPFEELPLRYELAYGGRDLLAEQELLAEIQRWTAPDKLRRARPSLEALFSANHPLMYPRNRFGKGYVLTNRRDFIEGRELPNLERPDDRLTPQRLIVPHPSQWWRQPLPAGFDFLDPLSFPRSAMLGLPPAGCPDARELGEFQRGLVPVDFKLNKNPFVVRPDQIASLIHPCASRCASLGLWLPFLRGHETVRLTGMNPRSPETEVVLPAELPQFEIRGAYSVPRQFAGQLLLVRIDANHQQLQLIWSARCPLPRLLLPGDHSTIEADVRVRMARVSL